MFSTEAFGCSELGMEATRDLIPAQTLPGLDIILVELHKVDREEDLINLNLNTTSIAEFQVRWFLGLRAGRFINVRSLITLQAQADG